MSSGTCRIFSALSNEVYKSMSHVMPPWSVIVFETWLSCFQLLLYPCLSWSGSRSVLSLWPDRFKQPRVLHDCRVEHNWFVLVVVVFLRYSIDNWHHLLQHRGRSCILRQGKSYFSSSCTASKSEILGFCRTAPASTQTVSVLEAGSSDIWISYFAGVIISPKVIVHILWQVLHDGLLIETDCIDRTDGARERQDTDDLYVWFSNVFVLVESGTILYQVFAIDELWFLIEPIHVILCWTVVSLSSRTISRLSTKQWVRTISRFFTNLYLSDKDSQLTTTTSITRHAECVWSEPWTVLAVELNQTWL